MNEYLVVILNKDGDVITSKNVEAHNELHAFTEAIIILKNSHQYYLIQEIADYKIFKCP